MWCFRSVIDEPCKKSQQLGNVLTKWAKKYNVNCKGDEVVDRAFLNGFVARHIERVTKALESNFEC